MMTLVRPDVRELVRTFFLTALLALGATAQAWQATAPPTNLGVLKPTIGQYEPSVIAICPFNVTGSGVDMETMPRIIRRDLQLSGFFKMPADQRACNQQNLKDHRGGTIDFAAWEAMGIEHYVMGRITVIGDSFDVLILLYDIKSRKIVINRRFRDHKDRLRFLAHTISDEIVQFLKGYKGVARTKLLYLNEQVPGVKEAALMDADGYGAKGITRFNKIVTGPAWGSNGTEFYFTSYHGNRANIYGLTLNADPAFNLVPGDMWTIAAYGGTNHSPGWNQRTGRIVMVLSKDGSSEIYSADRSGKGERRLTETKFTEGSPAWSSDGSKIAFTSNEAGGVHLFMMNADGSNRRRITSNPGWHDAVSWSPEGNRLAFVWRPNNQAHHDIFTCDVDGANYRRLTLNQGNNESPTWAPDGRHLAFQSDRSGTWQIYSMLDDGSAQFQLTASGRNTMPDWSPFFGE